MNEPIEIQPLLVQDEDTLIVSRYATDVEFNVLINEKDKRLVIEIHLKTVEIDKDQLETVRGEKSEAHRIVQKSIVFIEKTSQTFYVDRDETKTDNMFRLLTPQEFAKSDIAEILINEEKKSNRKRVNKRK